MWVSQNEWYIVTLTELRLLDLRKTGKMKREEIEDCAGPEEREKEHRGEREKERESWEVA